MKDSQHSESRFFGLIFMYEWSEMPILFIYLFIHNCVVFIPGRVSEWATVDAESGKTDPPGDHGTRPSWKFRRRCKVIFPDLQLLLFSFLRNTANNLFLFSRWTGNSLAFGVLIEKNKKVFVAYHFARFTQIPIRITRLPENIMTKNEAWLHGQNMHFVWQTCHHFFSRLP